MDTHSRSSLALGNLHVACTSGSLAEVARALDDPNVLPNEARLTSLFYNTGDEYRVLRIPCTTGNVDLLHLLLAHPRVDATLPVECITQSSSHCMWRAVGTTRT